MSDEEFPTYLDVVAIVLGLCIIFAAVGIVVVLAGFISLIIWGLTSLWGLLVL